MISQLWAQKLFRFFYFSPEYKSSFLFPILFDFLDSDFRTFPTTPPELISGASIFFVPDDMPGPSKNFIFYRGSHIRTETLEIKLGKDLQGGVIALASEA